MSHFRSLLADGRIHFFDGGFGALLQSRGLPPGVSPELFGLANPEPVAAIHAEYAAAGAEIITTNTFGGTRFKLDPGMDARALNAALARTAKQAVAGRAFVAGSVGPTGHFVQPMGELSFRDMVAAYREQILGLAEGGADLILGETQFDLAEPPAFPGFFAFRRFDGAEFRGEDPAWTLTVLPQYMLLNMADGEKPAVIRYEALKAEESGVVIDGKGEVEAWSHGFRVTALEESVTAPDGRAFPFSATVDWSDGTRLTGWGRLAEQDSP